MTRAQTKRKTSPPRTPGSGAPLHPPLYYRLHALLHTVRAIAAHEDPLCILLNEIRTTGIPSSASGRAFTAELGQILEELPSTEFRDDLDAVRNALALPSSPSRKAAKHRTDVRSAAKLPAKRAATRSTAPKRAVPSASAAKRPTPKRATAPAKRSAKAVAKKARRP